MDINLAKHQRIAEHHVCNTRSPVRHAKGYVCKTKLSVCKAFIHFNSESKIIPNCEIIVQGFKFFKKNI